MDPGGTLALGWPPTGAFGSDSISISYPPSSFSQDGHMEQRQDKPSGQPQGMRPNFSTDSLSSYFDSRIVLADSAAAAAALNAASDHDGMDPLEGLDSAALGRLLPDLEASDHDPTPGPSGRASTDHVTPTGPGRPMRRRIGSVEDDIFSAVGGLELGHDPHDLDSEGNAGAGAAAAFGEHMVGEAPSRTLFVRNVGPDVADEDIRALFQSHGEIRTLYTACKHRGFVVVSYYDLRPAVRALQLLQGAVLGGRSLELHFTTPKGKADSGVNQGIVVVFNLDPDTTDEQLVWIFSKFGEVKDIRESPTRRNQKFIQFYDVRHAAAALKAMNKAELSAPSASGRPPAGASSGGLHSASSGASSSGASGAERGAGGHGSVHGGAAAHQHEQQHQQHQHQLHQQQAQQAGAAAQVMQQQRGMIRPASGIINTVTGASPVSLGPMSQSWDPATEDSGLLGWLGRGQGAAAVSAAQQQLQQQQQAQQAQQQQQLLRDQATLQQALQQGLQADALLSSLGGGVSMEQLRNASGSTLSKLANAAQLLGGSGGRGGANLHVSDSASSIASTTASGPLFSSAGNAVSAQLQQSLAAQQQVQQQQQQQQQAVAQQQAVEQLARAYGSSDQLQGMESLLAPQGNAGRGNLMMNSASFGSGLNLADDANQAAANLLAGSYQTGSYPQLADQGAGMYGLRSLSNPALAATAAAAAAAQQNAAAVAGQLWGGGSGAAAQAMLNAQAAAGYQELAMRQQQQLALQLAGLQAGLQAQGLVGPGGLSTAQLLQSAAAAGLLPPTMPGGGGLLPPGLSAASLSAMAAGMGGYGQGNAGMGSRSASTNSLAGMGLSGHLSASSSRHGSAADLSRAASGSGGGGRLSRRSTDPAAEAERKAQQDKLFALDLDRIRRGDDRRTTLMVKNIPNKYTQKMLLQTIDEHCHGMYDFFYLPIDFKNKCNVGYAFINMLAPEYIIPLVERFDRRRWDKFNSEKVCHISYARIQGRVALVTHFQNSSLMHEDKRCRPVLFQVEGPEAGEQEPFPVGPNVRPRGAHLSFRDPVPPTGRSASRLG